MIAWGLFFLMKKPGPVKPALQEGTEMANVEYIQNQWNIIVYHVKKDVHLVLRIIALNV